MFLVNAFHFQNLRSDVYRDTVMLWGVDPNMKKIFCITYFSELKVPVVTWFLLVNGVGVRNCFKRLLVLLDGLSSGVR